METNGWLFDLYPLGDRLVLWFITEAGKRLRLEDDFPYCVYLGGPPARLRADSSGPPFFFFFLTFVEFRIANSGAALTVNDMLDEYYEAKIAHRSKDYRKSSIRYLDLIRNTIGTMPPAMVSPGIILDKVGLRGMWIEKRPSAEALLSHLGRIFSMAKVRCGLSANPAAWKDNLGTFFRRKGINACLMHRWTIETSAN